MLTCTLAYAYIQTANDVYVIEQLSDRGIDGEELV